MAICWTVYEERKVRRATLNNTVMRKLVTEMKNEDRREENQARRVSCRTKNTLQSINIGGISE